MSERRGGRGPDRAARDRSRGEPPFRKPAAGVGERRSYDPEARRAELPEGMPTELECPFCGGSETEVMSAFGSHASVSTYWCRACRSPFEAMRWRGEA